MRKSAVPQIKEFFENEFHRIASNFKISKEKLEEHKQGMRLTARRAGRLDRMSVINSLTTDTIEDELKKLSIGYLAVEK